VLRPIRQHRHDRNRETGGEERNDERGADVNRRREETDPGDEDCDVQDEEVLRSFPIEVDLKAILLDGELVLLAKLFIG
jgi:hypothetical protein